MLAAVLLVSAGAARAHEFWLDAAPYAVPAGGAAEITLLLGEFYVGERVGVTASHAASVRLLSATGRRDLGELVPAGRMLSSLRLPLPRAGAYVLAYDSHPSTVTLAADKFHAYLHEEGLDGIIRQREAAGTAASAGRERFRRHAKALLRAGARSDGASLSATGQRMEIVPLADPLAASAGQTLRFQLRFDGQPLAGVLVKAWHKRSGQTLVIRATADRNGQVTLDLPFAGTWLLNAVHMIPVAGVPEVDWDSFWSSLTFELAPARDRAR